MWRNTKALIIFGFCLGLIIVPNFVSAIYESWGACRNITIDHNDIDSDLTDFPLMVKLNSSRIDYSKTKDDGSDIRFADAPCYSGGSALEYGIEKWNESGDSFIWVKVPSVSSSTDTIISVYYDNPTASSNENMTAVWDDNTVGVFLFNETTGNVNDYSASPLTNTGQSITGQGILSKVDGGVDATTQSDYIKYSSASKIEFGSGSSFTVCAWFKTTDVPSGYQNYLIYKRISGGTGWYLAVSDSGTGIVTLKQYRSGGNDKVDSSTAGFNNGEWWYVCAGRDGSTLRMFVNGAENATTSSVSTGAITGANLELVGLSDVSSSIMGYQDTTIISNTWRGADWIKADYESQRDDLLTFSSEQTGEPTEITITDLKESPTDPATYSYGATYQFNATICDTEGAGNISSVKFEWSGSNTTITDYTTINATCREYYTSKSDLSADTYNYKWYAEDTTNSLYDSETGSYTINKATPSLSHSVTSPITYGTASDYTASESNSGDSDCSYILERNGTQIDTGSSVSDTTVLGAGTYNYTYYTTGGQNYTSNSATDILTVNKASANFSLSSSPSWNVAEGTSVTITAEATPNGTITLYKDGNIVSNPYTASLPYGTYNFTATYDHANYTADPITKFLTVSSGGFGCTDNETYAFEKTISATGTLLNLNFTDLVADNLVRSDLKDVYINQSVVSNVWTNFTDGYYIVVNTTDISSFDVKFGNYIANNSYTNHSLSENTTDMTGYTQINPYYVLTFIEESDGTQQLPPDTNSTTVSLFCSGGVSSFDVEDDKLLVSSFNQLTDIKATVTYSATEIYYRNYMVSSEIEYKYVYLVDANQHQVVQLLLTLQDNTGDFSGSTLKIKKYLEGSLRTITEQQFDVENKVVVYLINGDKYLLTVDNGVEERSIGYLNVDPVDLEKTLVLYSIETTNMTVIENMSYDLSYNGVSIEFTWIDVGGQTDSVEFWVYNYTNKSQTLYYDISYNHSYVNFVYNVPIENDTYVTKWLVHHNIFGLNSTGRQDTVSYGDIYPASFPLRPLVQYLGGDDVIWFALLIILPLPMLFTRKHAGIGAFFLVGIIALFRYWHFIDIPVNYIGIGIFIAFLIEIINRRVYS